MEVDEVYDVSDYVVLTRPKEFIKPCNESNQDIWSDQLLPKDKVSRRGMNATSHHSLPLNQTRKSNAESYKGPDENYKSLMRAFKEELRKGKKDYAPKDKDLASKKKITKESTDETGKILDEMKKYAISDQAKLNVLNARDNLIRLKDSKKGGSSSKKVIGNCPDMCPEKERYRRIYQKCLSLFETKMAQDSEAFSKEADHRFMVKEYARSSADQQEPLANELRPVNVLRFTMDHLICNILDVPPVNISIGDWYDFIWNRTRSIRKDITQQALCDENCVDIIEKCARFHILCAEFLSEEDISTFDPKINNENLNKCLQTLKHMYQDLQSKGIKCPNEAEFRAYDILLSLTEGEALRLVKDIRLEIFKSHQVKLAFQIALAFRSNNYIRFFKLMEKAPFLSSCIMHRYVNDARVKALQIMVRTYSTTQIFIQYPMEKLVNDLRFDSITNAVEFCKWYGLTADESFVVLQRATLIRPSSSFPTTRSSVLVGKKLTSGLGEFVNNGPLLENPLRFYVPEYSFTEDDKFQPEIYKQMEKLAAGKNETKEHSKNPLMESDDAVIKSKSSKIKVSQTSANNAITIASEIPKRLLSKSDKTVLKESDKNFSFSKNASKHGSSEKSKNKLSLSENVPLAEKSAPKPKVYNSSHPENKSFVGFGRQSQSFFCPPSAVGSISSFQNAFLNLPNAASNLKRSSSFLDIPKAVEAVVLPPVILEKSGQTFVEMFTTNNSLPPLSSIVDDQHLDSSSSKTPSSVSQSFFAWKPIQTQKSLAVVEKSLAVVEKSPAVVEKSPAVKISPAVEKSPAVVEKSPFQSTASFFTSNKVLEFKCSNQFTWPTAPSNGKVCKNLTEAHVSSLSKPASIQLKEKIDEPPLLEVADEENSHMIKIIDEDEGVCEDVQEVEECQDVLDKEDEETLLNLREEKIIALAQNILEEVYESLEKDLKLICEIVLTKEREESIKIAEEKRLMEQYHEELRWDIARKSINKWKMFCQRRRHRRLFEDPVSPWQSMLINSEYRTSGAISPFTVYKKHVSVSRLTDSKIKEKTQGPNWDPCTPEDFPFSEILLKMPPAYLKTTGIKRFIKVGIVFLRYFEDGLLEFVRWITKKLKLPIVLNALNSDGKYISFFVSNKGQTVICFRLTFLSVFEEAKNEAFTSGLSAVIVCCPSNFPDSLVFKSLCKKLRMLLDADHFLMPIPHFAFLLSTNGAYEVTSRDLQDCLQSEICSTLRISELENLSNYSMNLKELIGAIKWLFENQGPVPRLRNCSLRNFMENVIAMAFNTLFQKISFQEFKPMLSMPETMISFYNKVISAHLDLLFTSYLQQVSNFWPPEELNMISPDFKFIDLQLQKKFLESGSCLLLPTFEGDSSNSEDLWRYVGEVASVVGVMDDFLFLSLYSAVKSEPENNWLLVLSKCADFLCNNCDMLMESLDLDVFYIQEELDELNFNDFWRIFLLSLEQRHFYSETKRKASEDSSNASKKKRIHHEDDVISNNDVDQHDDDDDHESCIYSDSDTGTIYLDEDSDKGTICLDDDSDEGTICLDDDDIHEGSVDLSNDSDDSIVCLNDVVETKDSDLDAKLTDDMAYIVDKTLSSLQASMKREQTEGSLFFQKLDDTLKNNDIPCSNYFESSNSLLSVKAPTDTDYSSDSLTDFRKSNRKSSTGASDWRSILGKSPLKRKSPADAISEKLAELRDSIEKNSILEDSLSTFMSI